MRRVIIKIVDLAASVFNLCRVLSFTEKRVFSRLS